MTESYDAFEEDNNATTEESSIGVELPVAWKSIAKTMGSTADDVMATLNTPVFTDNTSSALHQAELAACKASAAGLELPPVQPLRTILELLKQLRNILPPIPESQRPVLPLIPRDRGGDEHLPKPDKLDPKLRKLVEDLIRDEHHQVAPSIGDKLHGEPTVPKELGAEIRKLVEDLILGEHQVVPRNSDKLHGEHGTSPKDLNAIVVKKVVELLNRDRSGAPNDIPVDSILRLLIDEMVKEQMEKLKQQSEIDKHKQRSDRFKRIG